MKLPSSQGDFESALVRVAALEALMLELKSEVMDLQRKQHPGYWRKLVQDGSQEWRKDVAVLQADFVRVLGALKKQFPQLSGLINSELAKKD